MRLIIVSLRCLLVLPGAIIAGSLARALVEAVETYYGQLITNCLMGITFAAVVVASGAAIAPFKKNAMGAVLLLLITGFVVVGKIYSWPTEDVKELVETIISDSWSFPALRP